LITSAIPRVVLLDFNERTDPNTKVETVLRYTLDWVGFGKMDLPDSHSHKMIQAGQFLDALPEIEPDDLVCLTDLDIEIQRDFTEQEWQHLEEYLWKDEIACYWNCLETDNLELEAKRIELSEEWKNRYGNNEHLRQISCMNCGVLIARASVFRKIQTVYEGLCQEFYANAPHRSRCQFLLNWCFHRMGLEVVTLSGRIHQHAHLVDVHRGDIILPAGASMRLRTVMFDGKPVIFKHAFPN